MLTKYEVISPVATSAAIQMIGGRTAPLNAASMPSAVVRSYNIRAETQERPITRQRAKSGAAMARMTLTGRVRAVGLNLVSELLPRSVVTRPLTPPVDASHFPPMQTTSGGPSRTRLENSAQPMPAAPYQPAERASHSRSSTPRAAALLNPTRNASPKTWA